MNAIVNVRITPLGLSGRPNMQQDSSCNLRPLPQWGDAGLPISGEEPENKLVLWDAGKVLSC
jgi:hypothetical protein